MVGETTMNRHNGSIPAPPNGVAKGMVELTHDIRSLVELQIGLFRKDCRDALKRLLIPVTMLLLAGIVAAATVPIALIRVGHVFERSRAEFTRNMTWLEQALTQSAPDASQQPQER
jgi:hypothetical protein